MVHVNKALEAVLERCSVKKVFLKISQESQIPPVPEPFLIKVVGIKDSSTGVFL